MPYEKTCPKCGQAMQEGWLLDRYGSLANQPTRWVPGPPERSLWFGVNFNRDLLHRIVAYRCTGCGLLESYAFPTTQT